MKEVFAHVVCDVGDGRIVSGSRGPTRTGKTRAHDDDADVGDAEIVLWKQTEEKSIIMHYYLACTGERDSLQ